MSDLVIAAIVAATPPTIVAVLAWRSFMKANEKSVAAIHEVHVSINSRMDQLLKASKAESLAEGRETGRAEGKSDV
jgi:hypothetical protein